MERRLGALEAGRHAEAEQALREAVSEAETLGPGDWRLGYSLAHLAGLYAVQQKSSEAEALFSRSLSLLNPILPPDHECLAPPLSGLAQLYLSRPREVR